MGISASIVLYKTQASELKHVVDCLFNSKVISALILVDNSPDNRLKDCIADEKVKYVFNDQNIGYGSGHNIAIREIIDQYEFHLVLNSDISFEPEVIGEIISYMKTHSDVGQLMPKISNFNGEMQYMAKLLPTPFDLFVRGFVPSFCCSKRRAKFQLEFADYNQTMNVPYLSGCFMFLRTQALKETGLFDERFFVHTEDIDLSRRIHKKYKTLYYPKVSILHKHAKESQKNMKMLFVLILNGIRYFNKWGWFFDLERRKTNMMVLKELNFRSNS
ncbi:MAG: glycosyltransferase [Bacteroidales bacterium]|nr:glycosyltransferase [Bacteroidales bacterium]